VGVGGGGAVEIEIGLGSVACALDLVVFKEVVFVLSLATELAVLVADLVTGS
jgi:hypothetical protein